MSSFLTCRVLTEDVKLKTYPNTSYNIQDWEDGSAYFGLLKFLFDCNRNEVKRKKGKRKIFHHLLTLMSLQNCMAYFFLSAVQHKRQNLDFWVDYPFKAYADLFSRRKELQIISFFFDTFSSRDWLSSSYATNHTACYRDEHCVQWKPKYDQ